MLGDADGNGIINFLDFLISMRYYDEMPETLPPKDLDGDGVAGRKDYLIFARDLGGIDENYIPNPLIIDDLLAFADVDGNGEVGATDYLIAYATLYEKEISECLTNGISLKTSMQAADINGDGEITEADKDIGIDYALNGSSDYAIGEEVSNTSLCNDAVNSSIITAQYAYNPSGLRNAKTVGGSTKYFVYNGMQIVFEYEDSISDGTIYYYGLNRTHNSNGEIYVYNAHGDTVQLVKDNAVVVSYTYDAFGNLISQIGESDNPFLYCSEYFDSETQTYYLRARYYNPANGRFNAEDPHWDITNRIYGDNPFKIYEYEDALGLSKYTLLPNDSAIMQSGNLYVYCVNNPISYVDLSGRFLISTAALLIAGGALLFGTIGGLVGNHIAEEKGATGWEKADYIVSGVAIGGTVGAVAGHVVAPAVVSATGVAGISVTSTGVSVVTVGGTIGTVGVTMAPVAQQLYDRYASHIFSQEHISNGIMNLGSDKLDIFNKIMNIANQYSSQWQAGSNEIRTIINGYETTIRFYISEGSMKSIDAFIGYSERVIGNLLK